MRRTFKKSPFSIPSSPVKLLGRTIVKLFSPVYAWTFLIVMFCSDIHLLPVILGINGVDCPIYVVVSYKPQSHWLRSRKEILYGAQNRKDTYLKEHTRDTEGRILELVVQSGSIGISKIKLAGDVPLDRKNLTKYLDRLMQLKLIRKGHGKQGKFYPSYEILDNVLVNGKFLSNLFTQRLLLKRHHLVGSDTRRTNSLIDFTQVPHFRPENRESFGLVQGLFEFSNTLGAYILYILIQAINPKNPIVKLGGKTEDLVIESWMTEAINGIIQMLLPAFKKIIEPHILEFLIDSKKSEDIYGALIKYNWVEPFFQVTPTVIDRLILGYRMLYPRLYVELSNIFESLPKEIESERLLKEYITISGEKQSACTHRTTFGKRLIRRINDVDFYGQRVEYRYVDHCPCCHYTSPKRFYKNLRGR